MCARTVHTQDSKNYNTIFNSNANVIKRLPNRLAKA